MTIAGVVPLDIFLHAQSQVDQHASPFIATGEFKVMKTQTRDNELVLCCVVNE